MIGDGVLSVNSGTGDRARRSVDRLGLKLASEIVALTALKLKGIPPHTATACLVEAVLGAQPIAH